MGNNDSASLLAVPSRIVWIMVGPLSLIVTLFTMIRSPGSWLGPADFVFFGVLAGMMAARWLEFQSGNPQTAEGQPATPAHLRRYLFAALVVGIGLWIAAKIAGNAITPS